MIDSDLEDGMELRIVGQAGARELFGHDPGVSGFLWVARPCWPGGALTDRQQYPQGRGPCGEHCDMGVGCTEKCPGCLAGAVIWLARSRFWACNGNSLHMRAPWQERHATRGGLRSVFSYARLLRALAGTDWVINKAKGSGGRQDVEALLSGTLLA